jgi:hypothetical protein
MSQDFIVRYTAYTGPNSSEVLSEGDMIVNAGSSYQAEQYVKNIFGNNRVILQGVRNG